MLTTTNIQRPLGAFTLAVFLLVLLVACGQKSATADQRAESREAKALLQGIWLSNETEDVFFKLDGDSVYYPDSTSMPAYFKVIDDTLYIGAAAGYPIVKHTEHLLWFKNRQGELVKLQKTADAASDERVFEENRPQVLQLTEVLKRDTVVFLNGDRYHCYVAVNPTKYRVTRSTINDEGMQVDNVYYDNIIHLSIFKGSAQVFSRDFRKPQYAGCVPAVFLEQAILNDMHYSHADAAGFHFQVSLCIPDDASCYLVDQTVSTAGKVSTRLQEK